jgi:hypothetical protein
MALSSSPKFISAEVVKPSVVITPVTSIPVEVVASLMHYHNKVTAPLPLATIIFSSAE